MQYRRVPTIINGKEGYIMVKRRENVRRYANGRIANEDVGESEAEARIRILRDKTFVARQPHRKGDGSVEGGSLIGRLINKGRVSDPSGKWTAGDFRIAVSKYHAQLANERWLIESRRPLAVTGAGSRRGPTDEEAADINAAFAARRHAIREAGPIAQSAIKYAIEDASPDQCEDVISFAYCYGMGLALVALCELWIDPPKR